MTNEHLHITRGLDRLLVIREGGFDLYVTVLGLHYLCVIVLLNEVHEKQTIKAEICESALKFILYVTYNYSPPPVLRHKLDTGTMNPSPR
jgi:hypothetical protein